MSFSSVTSILTSNKIQQNIIQAVIFYAWQSLLFVRKKHLLFNLSGDIILPTQTMHWEIPENYHRFVLFDSPEMGSIMTPVSLHMFIPNRIRQSGGRIWCSLYSYLLSWLGCLICMNGRKVDLCNGRTSYIL